MTSTARDLFKLQKQEWIAEAREVAHKLLKKYYGITIEDVLRVHPLPSYLHRNTIGAVFNSREFKRLGYEMATNKAARGHIISRWTEKVPSDEESAEIADIPLYRKFFHGRVNTSED